MTDHAAGHPAATENPFSTEEVAMLHAADRAAARNIVVLMLSIFLTGIAIYGVVDYVVSQ